MTDIQTEIQSAEKKVVDILTRFPETRVNDNLLVWRVWAEHDLRVLHQVIYDLGDDKITKLTASETITRVRRLLNKQGKFLVVDVHERRQRREEEVRKHFATLESFSEG